ncbi:SAM-depedent methyltransferase [Anopheles sinensis]|uniref:SAM-depedent methyltransferase n=1 Tax=Anopheles sinensis TaxID=74873 RepID=A0A084WAN4_ANOSI|nr:SAM-depedent methyltransferase [Anopheles sinensis]
MAAFRATFRKEATEAYEGFNWASARPASVSHHHDYPHPPPTGLSACTSPRSNSKERNIPRCDFLPFQAVP